MKFIIKEFSDGWYWGFTDGDALIARGGAYPTKEKAQQSVRSVKTIAADATVTVK